MHTLGACLKTPLVVAALLFSAALTPLTAQTPLFSASVVGAIRGNADTAPSRDGAAAGRNLFDVSVAGGPVVDVQAMLDRQVDELSLRRHVLWGAAAGLAGGVVSGLIVWSACDGPCDDSVTEGMLLHMGVGTAVGAVAGALVYRLR